MTSSESTLTVKLKSEHNALGKSQYNVALSHRTAIATSSGWNRSKTSLEVSYFPLAVNVASFRPAERFVNPLLSLSPHSLLVARVGLTAQSVILATRVVPTTNFPLRPVKVFSLVMLFSYHVVQDEELKLLSLSLEELLDEDSDELCEEELSEEELDELLWLLDDEDELELEDSLSSCLARM